MKQWIALFLAITMLLSLTACGLQDDGAQPQSDFGLWFTVNPESDSGDTSAVVWEERQWEKEPSALDLVKALVEEGPLSEELSSPFPEGVWVRGIFVDKSTGVVQVDLSDGYRSLVGFDLTVADYCIALTLCQLPGIDTVRIKVEGELLSARDRQSLQVGDVLLSGIAEEPTTFLTTLYFPRWDGKGLTAEYRQVTRSDGDEAVKIVVTELLRGPVEDSECLPLPEGTQVRKVSIGGGLCYVDLSHDFVRNAPQSEARAALMLYALVNTLCSLGEINQVLIQVGGQPLDSYGGVNTMAPLSANYDLIR